MILEEPVFWSFFGSRKSMLLEPKMNKIIVVVRPGGAKRSIKMRLWSLISAFQSPKVPPYTIFYDFEPDLGWILHVFRDVFVALALPKSLRSIVSPSR